MAPTRPNLLVIVRHGQSERNVAREGNTFFPDDESRQALRGEADHRTPLTELGWQQARDAGHRIREQFGTFDYGYHSGYRRAAQTAEFMLEAYSAEERAALQVRHNLFLREREPGFAFDMTTAEATAAFPWLQEYWVFIFTTCGARPARGGWKAERHCMWCSNSWDTRTPGPPAST